VLDGWYKEEAVGWLVAEKGKTEGEAREVYALCGGNIREMLMECASPGAVEKGFQQLLRELDEKAVKLALTSTEFKNERGNPDRLRTMFEVKDEDHRYPDIWKYRMDSFQVVDSLYLLRRLREKLGTGAFLHAYRLSEQNNMSTAAGVHFESVVHRRVQDMAGSLKIGYCQSVGTGDEGLEQLNAEDLYWVPSTQNFPLVESALVHNRKLFVFQMTIMESKDKYCAKTLQEGFVSKVRKKLAFVETVVFFVVPRGRMFRLPTDTPDVKFLTHEIDTTDLTTIEMSLKGLFGRL
jgi:hypothetical protein